MGISTWIVNQRAKLTRQPGITYLNPLRYAISITRQIYLEAAGFGQLFPEMLAMLVIAGVTLPIAAWMFRNRLA